MTCGRLTGLRVMIVEDELLVAMLIEDSLVDEGCIIIGPFSNVAAAMDAIGTASIDVAVLDVNLRGEKVYPVALRLAQQGTPFLLLSGYGEEAIPPEHPEWEAFSKPFRAGELVAALARHNPRKPTHTGL